MAAIELHRRFGTHPQGTGEPWTANRDACFDAAFANHMLYHGAQSLALLRGAAARARADAR